MALIAAAACSRRRSGGDPATDCFSEDIERRIEGCTALIEQRDQRVADLSLAYAMRALAYSLKGRYATAIPDYDAAIRMRPDFAVALNNRAWAYFRWGKAGDRPARRREVAGAQPDQPAHARHPRPHPPGAGRPEGGAARLRPRPCGTAARA